ncbi:MAG: phosphatase PAP2 family protein [Gammaproteobacteria bacterium]|nr:phosphatase PAP2 family protein [Gammaproteobacteria bacterium]
MSGGLFAIVILGQLDLHIADEFFFSPLANNWIGAHTWWAVDLIHTGGGWFVRMIGLAALITLVSGFWLPRLRRWRRDTAYLTLAMILVPTVVGAMQLVTNVDCPWNLDRYGGDRPYVSLLADRPDDLPRSACFPGSHSSSGFSLMAFYFLLFGPRPRMASWFLAGAVLIGTIFSLGQQSRGAHFLSHDLASAAIAWFLLLALWRLLLASGNRQKPGCQPRVASSSANPAT